LHISLPACLPTEILWKLSRFSSFYYFFVVVCSLILCEINILFTMCTSRSPHYNQSITHKLITLSFDTSRPLARSCSHKLREKPMPPLESSRAFTNASLIISTFYTEFNFFFFEIINIIINFCASFEHLHGAAPRS
jgi:hypothetical protein